MSVPYGGLDGNAVQHLITSILNNAMAMASKLVPMSNELLTTILVLMIAWTGIKMLLEGGSMMENLSSFFALGFTWGICKFILDSYGTIIPSINNEFNDVISAITGVSAKNDIVSSYLVSVFNMISAGLDSIAKAYNDAPGFFATLFDPDKSVTGFAFTLAIKIIVFLSFSVLALLASFIVFVMYNMALLLWMLGMIVGPMLIPFLLLPPATEYFSKWLAFMVNAGMLKVVTITIASLIKPIFHEINKITSAFATSTVDDSQNGFSFIDLGGVTITSIMYADALLFLGAILLLMAPSITQAMLPGGLGVGGIKFKSMGLGGGKGAPQTAASPPQQQRSIGGGGKAAAIDAMLKGKLGQANAKDFIRTSARK